MSNPYKTPEFKALFKEWNQKLEESGHSDIEDWDSPRSFLKEWHSFKFMNMDQDTYQATKKYYEWAKDVLNEHTFKTNTERLVWSLHSDGVSGELIPEILNLKKVKRATVYKIINRIKKETK